MAVYDYVTGVFWFGVLIGFVVGYVLGAGDN